MLVQLPCRQAHAADAGTRSGRSTCDASLVAATAERSAVSAASCAFLIASRLSYWYSERARVRRDGRGFVTLLLCKSSSRSVSKAMPGDPTLRMRPDLPPLGLTSHHHTQVLPGPSGATGVGQFDL